MDTRVFHMERGFDESNVSGTGIVLVGVIFPSGKTVVEWSTEKQPSSMSMYNKFDDFVNLHIKTHPKNQSVIHWDDGTMSSYEE